MKIGLIVEGSNYDRRSVDQLQEMWGRELRRIVDLPAPARVFGISKASLAAMKLRTTALRRTTAVSEPLDSVLERLRRRHELDCFVIVWDLVPPWDKAAKPCRWEETLALFEGLALSELLDRRFKDFAAARLAELRGRASPSARTKPPRLAPGSVVAVCVEPELESIFMNEHAMRKCLNMRNTRARDWPRWWDPLNPRASDVVADAVECARKSKKGKSLLRGFPHGYKNDKTAWGIHFLRSRLFDEFIESHPFGRRLSEIEVARERPAG